VDVQNRKSKNTFEAIWQLNAEVGAHFQLCVLEKNFKNFFFAKKKKSLVFLVWFFSCLVFFLFRVNLFMGNQIGVCSKEVEFQDFLLGAQPCVDDGDDNDTDTDNNNNNNNNGKNVQKFLSAIFIWSFLEARDSRGELSTVTCKPVDLLSFEGFSQQCCYVTVLIQRGFAVRSSFSDVENGLARSPLGSILESSAQNLTPRGLCASLSLSSRQTPSGGDAADRLATPPVEFDVYVWNGQNASSLTRVCFFLF
jgi:hypothetical protein